MLAKFIKFLFKTIVVALVTLGGSFILIQPFVRGVLWSLGWNTDATWQITYGVWVFAWGVKIVKGYMNFDWLFGGKNDKSGCKCNSESK